MAVRGRDVYRTQENCARGYGTGFGNGGQVGVKEYFTVQDRAGIATGGERVRWVAGEVGIGRMEIEIERRLRNASHSGHTGEKLGDAQVVVQTTKLKQEAHGKEKMLKSLGRGS